VRTTPATDTLSMEIFEPIVRATASYAGGLPPKQLKQIAAFLAAHRTTLEHYLDAT
jgi:hypothetical protein